MEEAKKVGRVDIEGRMEMGQGGETTLAERDIWARQPGDDMVEGVVSMSQRFWKE